MAFFELAIAVPEELLDVEVDAGVDVNEGRVWVGKKESVGLKSFNCSENIFYA